MIQIVMYPSTLLVGGTSPVELMVIYALAETVTASNDARKIRVTLSAPDQPSYAYSVDVAVVDHAGSQTVQIVAGELSLRNGGSYWLTVQLMVGNGVLARDVKRSILAGTESPTQTSLVPTMAPSMPPTSEAVDSAMIVPVNIGSYRVGVIRDRTIFIKFGAKISAVNVPVWRSAILDFFWAYFGVVSDEVETIAFYRIFDGTVAVVEFATASLATRLRSALQGVAMVIEVAGESFLGIDMYLVQTDEGLTVVEDAGGFVQPTDPVANVLEEGSKKESSKSNNSLATVIMPVAIAVVALAMVVIIALGVVSLLRKRRIAQKSDSFDAEHFTIRQHTLPAYETPSWLVDKAPQLAEAPCYVKPDVAYTELEGAERAWQEATSRVDREGYDNSGDDGYEIAGFEESSRPGNSRVEIAQESDYELAAPTVRGGSPDDECDYQLAGNTVGDSDDECDYQLASSHSGSANNNARQVESDYEFASSTEHGESAFGCCDIRGASLVSAVYPPVSPRGTSLKRPPPVFPGDLIYNDRILTSTTSIGAWREYLQTMSVEDEYSTVSSCRGSEHRGAPIQGSALTKLVSQLTETLSQVSSQTDSAGSPRSKMRTRQSSQTSENSSTSMANSRMRMDTVAASNGANLEDILAMVGASDEASILEDYEALMVESESGFLDT